MMDDGPLFVLAATVVLMLIGSVVESIHWLVPMTAPVGLISAFLSFERRS
jgi:hypothetical protein